jgi:hypothetical protein
MKTLRSVLMIAFAFAVVLGAGVTQGQAPAQEKETFTGLLAQMSGAAAGATGSLQITVERWTTPEERKAYIEALLEGKNEKNLEAKQRKLVDMMEDARGDKRVGFARFPRTLGWDLTYAWQFMQGSTRVVRLATNRPIAFVEARNSYRTMDYPFGFIEFKLNEKGEGEGLAFQATSLIFNKDNVLEVETYGIGPQRILSVRAEKEKPKEKK